MPSFGGLSASQIETRLKEGRGQGARQRYKPFLTVRDVSSPGRSHRVFGTKTQRIHHLLSDLELAVFLMLDWSEAVTDIREQFPLNVDNTVRLAGEAGIRHAAFKGIHQVMTSDFLVDTTSISRPQLALQIKYAKDLEDRRTVEKLELERRYWHSKDIPWFIVTENDICREAVKNIDWFSPILNDDVSLVDLHHFYSLYESYSESHPTERVVSVAPMIDKAEGLEPGEALYWLRHLLGRRYFLFDITQPYQALLIGELLSNTTVPTMEESNAAG
jgi:hypothetical protein